MTDDYRLQRQRANFTNALAALKVSVATPVAEARDRSGIIKDFEIVYELSWKVLRTFLEQRGHEVLSARDAFALAYRLGYLKNESVWLEMIADRNRTVHTYDERFAEEMAKRIRAGYVPAFRDLLSVVSGAT